MKPPDKGLLLSSRVDFTIPSPFAREHLYYLIQYGRYQCVPGYEVNRDFLDMYLCAYVRSGSLHTFCGSARRCAITASICSNEFIILLSFYFSSGFSHSVVKKQVRCPVWQTGPLGVPT